MKTKRKLVPNFIINAGTQAPGNSNAHLQNFNEDGGLQSSGNHDTGFINLDEDVGDSKRRCVRTLDTMLHSQFPLQIGEPSNATRVQQPMVPVTFSTSESVSHSGSHLPASQPSTHRVDEPANRPVSSGPPLSYRSVGKYNEVDNRMSHFGGDNSGLRRDIVEGLIDLLDTHNALVHLFRTAREKLADTHVPNFKVRLYNVVGAREYELPTGDMLGAIVYEPGPDTQMDYDIVLEERSGYPQRVNKLHPSYMSLQFPLLFLYGEDGYSKDLKLVGGTANSNADRRLTMKAYYAYFIHDRANCFNYLSRTGRLFQQYVVTAFCAIEQNWIDFIREHQNDIRNEYLSGIYDAISRDNGKGGGHLVFLIGGRISRNIIVLIGKGTYGCQDKKGMEKQHGVNIMAVYYNVQILSILQLQHIQYPFHVEDDSDIGFTRIDGPPIMPEDPYAYIMAAYEVPPSPDYIPGPEVPPSPDYIPGPEVPPSPDYIPGPKEPQSPPPLDFVPELMIDGTMKSRRRIQVTTLLCGDDDDPEDEDRTMNEERGEGAPSSGRLCPTALLIWKIPESYGYPLRKMVRYASPTPIHECQGEFQQPVRIRQDRPAIAKREAKMAREAWGLSIDASDYARLDVMSLRTTVVVQRVLILELQSADHKRQRVISELLASDHKRQVQLTKTLRRVSEGQLQVARECTYHRTYLKCQPLNFKGTEGVVGLTQWFEKMESVYSISNYTVACQVKFAMCTLQGNALTWWNSHVKTTTPEAAHAMPWRTLKKMMTDKYCPRGEIKKLEFEMWNLKVKDQVEKYVGGLPDTIHGSVMATKPKTMQDAIEFATELMDKKINTWAERQADNKRKSDDTARNNQNQQPNKRQNTRRAYAAGNGDRRPYGGPKPLCSKCNYHHEGPCAPKCHKCNRFGHLGRDCKNPLNVNTRANQRACFECGAQGHFKKDCPKLKNNNNRGNQVGNAKTQTKVYAMGNAGANPDNNVVMGTFLLNNQYASILFDTGADRSFVSTAFSSRIVITPTALDHDYNVELADGRIVRSFDEEEVHYAKVQKKKQFRRKQKKTTAVPHPSNSTAHVPNEQSVPTHSNDLLFSGEDRLKITDLMDMCTKLSERVIDLEHTKTAQAQEITNLKPRVKKLEKKARLRTHKFKRLYKVGVTRRVEYSDDESLGAQKDAFNQGRSIEDIDKDAKVSLVDETQGRSDDAEMFDTDAIIGNEVFTKNDMIKKDQDVIPKEVSTADPSTTAVSPPVITEVEITLAQTLAKLKSAKSKVVIQEPVQSTATTTPLTIPKAKGITFRDAGESTIRIPTLVSFSSIKDKGKAKMDEPEVPLKKKDQIALHTS
ncbi:putative reverse transcriptase domain-containing protein [Tanacetum coccineum]|uniref:Reverse transcriptase domain-containing protein n=1 Tax=Tanacetum coccineum TaxID=301880 RepID=A0ABQ4WZ51_9ASTR